MVNLNYPKVEDLKLFINIIRDHKYPISIYLPSTNEEWFRIISECVQYVEHTSHYDDGVNIQDVSARLLYKIAKRHELGDGNKRSAVITVYIFCILNNCLISNPKKLKEFAKRISSTKGRTNEDVVRKRIANKLSLIIKPFPRETER